MISTDLVKTFCKKNWDLTKTLYQCVYNPEPRVRTAEKEVEEKCLQMRKVLSLSLRDMENPMDTMNVKVWAQLMRISGNLKLEGEDSYQEMLTKLVNHCDVKSGLIYMMLIARDDSFGIVNYVKECPDLFFNDLIEKIIQSEFSLNDKLEIVNRILNCYHTYLERFIDKYTAVRSKDERSQDPSPMEQILEIVEKATEGKHTFKGYIKEEIETLLGSYKIALNHLFILSKDCLGTECLKDFYLTFYGTYDGYKIDYIKNLFKLISVVPIAGLRDQLLSVAINYLTLIRSDSVLRFVVYCAQKLFIVVGVSKGLNRITNGYLHFLVSALWIAAEAIAQITLLVSFKKSFPNADWYFTLSNKILYPLLYVSAIIMNFYILGGLIF